MDMKRISPTFPIIVFLLVSLLTACGYPQGWFPPSVPPNNLTPHPDEPLGQTVILRSPPAPSVLNQPLLPPPANGAAFTQIALTAVAETVTATPVVTGTAQTSAAATPTPVPPEATPTAQ
jgi:hypothetical protein